MALKVLPVGEDGQAGGTTLFVAAGEGNGLEVGADDALAGAGFLDFGDDGGCNGRRGVSGIEGCGGCHDPLLDGAGEAARRVVFQAFGDLAAQGGFAQRGTGGADFIALGGDDSFQNSWNFHGDYQMMVRRCRY